MTVEQGTVTRSTFLNGELSLVQTLIYTGKMKGSGEKEAAQMKKVFFYGDSNTYGYDPAGFFGGRYPRQYRWTAILKDKLAGEWEVAADGMPGRAIPPKGRAMEYLLGSMRAEMPVDLFAVMLGTNDILGTSRPDAARTAKDMEDLAVFIKNAGIPQILLIAPPKISFTPQSFEMSYVYGDSSSAPLYCGEGRKLTESYRELAARLGLWFADASSWDLDFAFDGVHLSEKGHILFANEMVKVMRAIAERG